MKRYYISGALKDPDLTPEQEWKLSFGQTADLLPRAYAGRPLFES